MINSPLIMLIEGDNGAVKFSHMTDTVGDANEAAPVSCRRAMGVVWGSDFASWDSLQHTTTNSVTMLATVNCIQLTSTFNSSP